MSEANTEATPPRKRPSLKMLGAVAGLMALEGAALVGFMSLTGPRAAHAGTELEGEVPDLELPVEIELVSDKFQNMQSGRVWLWDLQVFLKVSKKHEAHVRGELERRSAEITEGISHIIRRAQHAHLKEPELRTLNRQLSAFLEGVIGPDPDGQSRIERILIPRCKGYQAD